MGIHRKRVRFALSAIDEAEGAAELEELIGHQDDRVVRYGDKARHLLARALCPRAGGFRGRR